MDAPSRPDLWGLGQLGSLALGCAPGSWSASPGQGSTRSARTPGGSGATRSATWWSLPSRPGHWALLAMVLLSSPSLAQFDGQPWGGLSPLVVDFLGIAALGPRQPRARTPHPSTIPCRLSMQVGTEVAAPGHLPATVPIQGRQPPPMGDFKSMWRPRPTSVVAVALPIAPLVRAPGPDRASRAIASGVTRPRGPVPGRSRPMLPDTGFVP